MTVAPDPDLFDTPQEEDFDRLSRLAADMVGAPIALLSLVDSDRQFFKSAVGLPEPWATRRETPLTHSLCRHVVEAGTALVVEDARLDPLVRDNLAVRDLGVVAYLGEPVRMSSGAVAGSLCVIDTAPRAWSERDRRIVRTLARAVENVIALRAATAAQREVMAELVNINEALSAQSGELAMARLTAETALARQTRFLAGLSHELRSPLNGIMGGLALLEAARDAEAARRCRTMIASSANALSDCVEDLITFCRLGAGMETVSFGPYNPRRTVQEAAEAQRAVAEAKGLVLKVEIDPYAPAQACGDGGLIARILVNLLGNAVKYTAEGQITAWLGRDADGALAYRVTDTGRGVPETVREAIFEPFNRGDPDVARSATGTGLGLAIAREMATRIGGSLTLERSTPGVGSTFLLRAPEPQDAAAAA